MRAKVWICVAMVISTALLAAAQEGHPLEGSWVGDWGPSATHRNPVVVVMDWDGKAINAVINPGKENLPATVTVNPADWSVHMEAEARDRAGNVVRFIIDGKIQGVGVANRSLVGTWSHGQEKGDFRIRRY